MESIQNLKLRICCQGQIKQQKDEGKVTALALEFQNNCKRELRNKLSEEDYKHQEKKNQNKVLLSSFLKRWAEAQNNFQNFIETLGPILTKKLPDSISKHLQHKPSNLKSLTHVRVAQFINQRIDKMVKNKRIKKNWTFEDLLILIWIVGKYVHLKNIKDVYYEIKTEDWEQISAMIPACSAQDCMFKWLTLKRVRSSWKKGEDDILIRFVEKKQNEEKEIIWNDIAKEVFYENSNRYKVYRGGKQCRERWNCFLNPNIKKGLWNRDQDTKLIKLILKSKGSKKWSKFVPLFGGRTQNALKNRFHLIIQKQFRLLGGNITDENEILTSYLERFLLEPQDQFHGKQESNSPQVESTKKIETYYIESCSQMNKADSLSPFSLLQNDSQFYKNSMINKDFNEQKGKKYFNYVPDQNQEVISRGQYDDIAQYLQM